MITKDQFLLEIEKIKFLNNVTPKTIFQNDSLLENVNQISWDLTVVENKQELINLKNVAGMSTLANAKIINLISKSLTPNELYVNIGTYQGFSLIAGLINTVCKVEGVDNFSQFAGPKDIFLKNFYSYKRDNTFFYDLDYVKYLQNKKEIIDFYFYDGPHKYQDQYNAIELASHLFKKGTLIMIDDTNLESVKLATFNALEDLKINYEIWLDVDTAHNKHPTFWNGILLLEIK